MSRPVPLLLLLPCLVMGLCVHAGAEDEEEQAARRARDDLIAEARRSIGGADSGGKALQSMRRGLAADVEFARTVEPRDADDKVMLDALRATIAERLLILGWPAADDENPVRAGALEEAARLGDWLLGIEPASLHVGDAGGEASKARAYTYPPEPEAPAVEKPPEDAGKEDDGKGDESGSGNEAAPGAGKEDGEPKKADDEKAPGADTPTEPAPPPDVLTWARKIVRAKEGGTLVGRVFSIGTRIDVEDLLRASKAEPVYVHPDVGRITRHALISGDGDVFAYSAPLAALRTVQSDEHTKAMQSDQPQPSLIDGAMVREKAAAVERFRELVTRHERRRAAILGHLDAMVGDLDDWKTQAVLLAGEIEDRRRAFEQRKKKGDTPGDESGDLGLRLAQARETLVTLDIMFLYLSARRAEARLELLDQLRRAAGEEATAAEQVHKSYEQALTELRSTRRLDRLAHDNRRLRRWVSHLEQGTHEPGSSNARRLDAYRAVLRVNEIVSEAVERRRQMSTGRRSGASEAPPAREASDDADATSRLSLLVREPGKASWNRKYVEIARRELLDPELRPEFGAGLVAEHHAAVNERIGALVAAYRRSGDETVLRARFAQAEAEARKVVTPLADDPLVRAHRLAQMLSTARDDLDAAMDGIEERRVLNQKRLEALVEYRKLLKSQGTRSLLIRIDRDVMDPDIGDALDDTRAAIDTASRWASFEGESHAGGFLAEAWLRVLVVLLVLAVALFGARLGRRLVDRWIERQVANHPELASIGASVREERERGRERREAADAAASGMSADEVLRHVREDDDRASEQERDS